MSCQHIGWVQALRDRSRNRVPPVVAGPERQDVTAMPKTRVIFTGIAVAAAAVAGSAFTAANDFSAPGVADDAVGYGETTVSGATVSKVVYTPVTGDPSKLDAIAFTSTTEIEAGNVATMYLKEGSTETPGSASDCVLGTFGTPTPGEQTITCTFTTDVDIDTFSTVALSVMPE